MALPHGLWESKFEPASLAVKAQSPTHWTAREFPII